MMNNTTHTANQAERFTTYLIDGLITLMVVVISSIIVYFLATWFGLGAESGNKLNSTSGSAGIFVAVFYFLTHRRKVNQYRKL